MGALVVTAALCTCAHRGAQRLLMAGAFAGPVYLIRGAGQAFLRPGFDPRIHALSLALMDLARTEFPEVSR